jgi:hypothetical protein
MHKFDRSDRQSGVHRRLTAVAFVAVLLFSGAICFASTYSCGNGSAGHCYGQTSWSEQTQYFGAYVDLQEPTMNCPSNCGGFIDNEIWLIDSNSSGCTSNSFGQCWVEAGYIAQSGQSTQFFWADSRPQTSSTFNLHILGDADPVGTTDHFMIVKDGRVSPQVFQVFVYNTSESTLYNGTSVTSGTPMAANAIHIGQELAGTQGASAGTADYTRNIWAVQSLGPEYVFWYRRETDEGSVRSDNPPFGSWAIDPSNPPPPEGGEFTTHCCG